MWVMTRYQDMSPQSLLTLDLIEQRDRPLGRPVHLVDETVNGKATQAAHLQDHKVAG
jgi:hypothetical protein